MIGAPCPVCRQYVTDGGPCARCAASLPVRAAPKPLDYHERRQWQDDARARGEVPECGREACHDPANPAWVNKHTPLLYCPTCARLINRYNPGLCSPEDPQEPR